MTTPRRLRPVFFILLIALLSAGLAGGHAQAATDPVLAAVGDMGCSQWDPAYNDGDGTATGCRQRYVSDLLVDPLPSALLVLGDNQYDEGELNEFQTVYHPTFGRANGVVYPVLGNAEYDTPNAQGYFDYFSSVGVQDRVAGTAVDASHWSSGYYSFDVGTWHVIALNSNCGAPGVGGCGAGSPQETWLKADLAAHPNRCTLAYWHHPRWNTGALGNDSSTAAFWSALYSAHADIVLNGHGNHHYERFMPMAPNGNATPDGIREFIVSTGGEGHGTPGGGAEAMDTSQVSDYTSFGVLRLTLHPTAYDWQFAPEIGGSFTDSGSAPCDATQAQPPGTPSLTATAADNSVHLDWTAPSNGGAAITGYKIYRGTSAGGETLLKTVGNVRATDDNGAVNGTKYYYRVSAVNSAGEGSQSNEVSATPAPATPQAPFPATSVLDDFARAPGPLGANWQSPGLADPGTVAIQAGGSTGTAASPSTATWKATTFAADQEAWLTVPTLPRAGSFLQIAGRLSNLTASSVSCYFLKLTPSTGVWDLRKKLNGAGSTSMKSFTAPFAAGDSAGIRISGSTITAFRKPAGGAWTAIGSTTDIAIPGAGYVAFTLGDTTIRGGAFGGGSMPAAPVAQRPGAPALSAAAGDAGVQLTWSTPSDGGSPITGYNVYRGTAAGGETLLKTVGDVTSAVDESAANGTTYYYRVAAINAVGEGALSNEVSATPVALATVPGKPSITAAAGDATVSLSWSAPPDGGAPISAYKLYRGTTAGGETLLKTVGNVTSTVDSTVTNGTTYYYRVAAVNAVGEGAASNEVSATPAGAPPPPPIFPRTGVIDGFARAAGTLGLNWQSPGLADLGTVSIRSSGLTGSSSGAASATWRTAFAADQEAYLAVPTLPRAGSFFQIAVRVSNLTSSSVSCYFLRVTPSTGVWDLRKKLNGATSTSIKTFTAPFTAGDAGGIQIVGSTITAYRKPALGIWAPTGSATDTSIPGAGYVSFTIGDTAMRGGAFGAGSIN